MRACSGVAGHTAEPRAAAEPAVMEGQMKTEDAQRKFAAAITQPPLTPEQKREALERAVIEVGDAFRDWFAALERLTNVETEGGDQ